MNVSLSGLFTAQRNLDTIAHNTANIQTDGYSRQATLQSASSPIRLFNKTGMVGTGAEVTAVTRIRDRYLDQKIWYQNTIRGEWAQKTQLVDQIQFRISGGSDGMGYNAVTNDFYAVLQELSKDPSNMSIRSVAKEQALTLTTFFNNLAENLEKIQEDTNFDIKTKVDLVNSLGHRIETLNKQIYQIEILGENANDLRDARDLLVEELSGLVNIEVGEHNFGKLPSGADDMRFYIYIGGTQFLQHFDSTGSAVNELKCVARQDKLNEEDIYGLFDVMWTKPIGRADPVNITGGALKGLLDVRDGNSGYAQYAKFNMLTAPPTSINIQLDVADDANPGSTLPLGVTVDFNEYVPGVEAMTADGLAALLADRINAALDALPDIDITYENRASVTTTEDGLLLFDLSNVKTSGGGGAELASFTLTAPAQLKEALGLEAQPGADPAKVVIGTKDIVQETVTNGYKGIPYYLRKLNEYVRTFAMAFNEGFIDSNTDKFISPDEVLTGHAAGYNITQEPGEPPASVRFFTMADGGGAYTTGEFLSMSDLRMPSLYGLDPESPEYAQNINAIVNAYQKVTAKNFTVSADIVNNVALIATSANAGDVEDNTNLLAVLAQRFNRHMFSEGSAEDFMQALTTDAAVDTNQAEFMYENQEKFIGLLTTRRESISGVWQDEEFADMIRQQHAYNACSMMISTFNQIYDTLINRLGLF